MSAAPKPPNEAQRLAALRRYGILDTPPEQAFDDLTLLAAQICQVPTAMVSLVDDDRQWFKSRIGLTASETARDIAFCAHTILDADTVLEVRDAQADIRFHDNPLVTGRPGVRFYAGAPLVSPDGHAIGALCVMDRQPRTLTPDQLAALRALSRHVIGQLELRRQAQELLNEIAERQRAEVQLRQQFEQLAANEQAANQLLAGTERSRRALLSMIEDEQQTSRKLRDSEERFRQLAENVKEVFWMTDPLTRALLYLSPAFEVIWGRSCRSLYAHPEQWLEAIHPEDRARVDEASPNRQTNGAYDEVFRIVRPDGAVRWIHDRAFPVRNEQGQVYRIVGTAEDITERKRAELRTVAQHAVTEMLAQGAPLLETARRMLEIVCRQLDWNLGDLWIVDRPSKTLRCVELWHPPSTEFGSFAAVSRALGFAEGEGLPGRVWRTRQPQWIADVTQDPTFRRLPQAAELKLRGALAFPIMLRTQVFGVVEFFSVQSRPPDAELLSMFNALGTQIGQFIERKQLEEQFRQAQKMEAIGTLAGGIAHDFSNVLAAIAGYTELAKAESRDNPEVTEYLDAVLAGSQRAVGLVRQIMAFSRLQAHERKSIQLWPIVEEALKLLRATIPTTIQFDTSLVRHGPTVLADPTQVHQIIMNLATNASHAMKDRPGRLGVTLENIVVDASLVGLHPGLRVGPYMRLGVSDSGHGMDQPTVNRIFDPFFTTKAPGEGTGLGLAVVHGIMQSHDGVIAVYSQPGEGTRFHLYFPAEAGESVPSPVKAAEIPRGHGECILIVDDENPLATMNKKVLEWLGYQAEAFTVPAEAVEAFRAHPDRYDLVITDQTMPGMTGTDLAGRLLQIRPDIGILLTTGYSATLTTERVRAMGIRDLIMKPLTMEGLGQAVANLLSDRPAT